MEERRKDDNKIAVLEERVSNWMDSTTEYRKDLCRKIDIITSKLNELPCKERKSIYDSVKGQLAVIWVVIAGVVGALFIEWIKK